MTLNEIPSSHQGVNRFQSSYIYYTRYVLVSPLLTDSNRSPASYVLRHEWSVLR